MTQHLIDTDIEVAQCPRCKQIGFKAHISGYAIAADATPLSSMDEIREALMAGRQVHRVVMRGGKPWRLKTIGIGDDFSGVLVGDHACGARPVSASVVEVIPQDPQQAPAQPGRPVDGLHHPEQPARPSQGHTELPAGSATRRRSEFVCDGCRKPIEDDHEFMAIEVPGQPAWAHHTDCRSPKLKARDILSRDHDWTALSQLSRRGVSGKPIETINLPEVGDGGES